MEILASYLFYFVSSVSSSLQRRHLALQRDTDKGQIDFAFRVTLITFVLSFILIFFKKPEFNQSLTTIALLMIVCGVSGSISIASQYIAQRHVEAGLTTLIGNIYTPITIFLSSILLHEGLEPRQIIGTVLLLFSVVLVSRKHRLSRWRFDKYFMLMVLNGVFLAFALVAERSLIKENGIAAGTWLSWGATVLCLGIAAVVVGAKSQYNFKDTAVTGGVRFLQSLSWVILVTIVANLSLVTAITTFKIVLMFVTAALWLHEREDFRRKIFGSFIAVAGLLLIA